MIHQVIFHYKDHRNLVEPSSQQGEWNLTQDVKSWLATNNIKVFMKYTNGDSPTITMDFPSQDDANYFIDTWGKK
jgi:hypothetical protein